MHSNDPKNGHKNTPTMVQEVDYFLEVKIPDVERRVESEKEVASVRLAKLFNLPEYVFSAGVDIYTAIAAHLLKVPSNMITKPQRNEVKARIVEWLYYGRTIR